MNLIKAAKKILHLTKKGRIEASPHYTYKSSDRAFDPNDAKHLMNPNKLVAIIFQEKQNVYKLIFRYTHRNDINFVVRLDEQKIILITVFQCGKVKRTK